MGCFPVRKTVSVTRPAVVATSLSTETPTAVPLATTPLSTQTPESALATTATAVLPTASPIPTNTPEPTWPTTPVLFVREGALQRWLPQTNEVEVLVQGVDSDPVYAPNVAVFMREVVPEEEYGLIVFHIPSRTEVELLRQPAIELTNELTNVTTYLPPLKNSVTVSPNGRWLAYVLKNGETGLFTLFAHEIYISNEQVVVSEVLFSRELPMRFVWPFQDLSWPTVNKLSWNEPSGIWVANLDTTPISSRVEILASTNTVLLPSMDPADADKEPASVFTNYLRYQWSPNGRFLLAVEMFPGDVGYSIFWIIERQSNRKFQLPDSVLGPLSDAAVWLNDEQVLHYTHGGLVRIWRLTPEDENLMQLETEFMAITSETTLFETVNLLPLPNNRLRFQTRRSNYALYDLDLNTQTLTVLDSKPNLSRFLWSPDGQGVLWISYLLENGQSIRRVFYDPLTETPATNLDFVFALDSCCWYWVVE
jgi:hypothetical protein